MIPSSEAFTVDVSRSRGCTKVKRTLIPVPVAQSLLGIREVKASRYLHVREVEWANHSNVIDRSSVVPQRPIFAVKPIMISVDAVAGIGRAQDRAGIHKR